MACQRISDSTFALTGQVGQRASCASVSSRPGRASHRPDTVWGVDLSVVFLGTGGSVPTARRATACVLARVGGERLMFDCGEGSQRQMQRSTGLVQVDEIYLTHYHADHYLGLPGLLKTYDLQARERPLRIVGPPGLAGPFRCSAGSSGELSYERRAGGARRGGGGPPRRLRGPLASRSITGCGAYGYALVEDERPGRFDPDAASRLGVTPGPDFGRLQAGEAGRGLGRPGRARAGDGRRRAGAARS